MTTVAVAASGAVHSFGPLTGLGVDVLLDAGLGTGELLVGVVGIDAAALDGLIKALLDPVEQESHQVVLGHTLRTGHLGQRLSLGQRRPELVGGETEELGHLTATETSGTVAPTGSGAVGPLTGGAGDHLTDPLLEVSLQLGGPVGVDAFVGQRLVDPLGGGLGQGGLEVLDGDTLVGGDVGQRLAVGEGRPQLLGGHVERLGDDLGSHSVGVPMTVTTSSTVTIGLVDVRAGRVVGLIGGLRGIGGRGRIIVGCGGEGDRRQHRSGGHAADHQGTGDHEALEVGNSHWVCQLLCWDVFVGDATMIQVPC